MQLGVQDLDKMPEEEIGKQWAVTYPDGIGAGGLVRVSRENEKSIWIRYPNNNEDVPYSSVKLKRFDSFEGAAKNFIENDFSEETFRGQIIGLKEKYPDKKENIERIVREAQKW